MKKIMALVLILCMIPFSLAFADDAHIVSDGSPLDFDGVVLTPQAGMAYTLGSGSANEVLITVYPFYAEGDASSNLNIFFTGAPFENSVRYVDSQRERLKEETIATVNTYGFTIESMEYTDSVADTIAGMPCITFDFSTVIVYQGISFPAVQRGLFMGSIGCVISITAEDTEKLDRIKVLADSMLTWK